MSTERLVKVTLTADTNVYKAKLVDAGQTTARFGATTKKSLADVETSTSRLGKSASAMSGAMKLASATMGTLAATKVVQFLGDSVQAASDLQQTILKSNVIFGRNAAEMNRWAQTAGDAFGLSKQAALAAASTFGDMFSQLGFGGEQAASMSRDVVQLAADLGSFNNLPTADVLDRISAGFRGEYDALQKVIPNINAARVETEALAMTGKASAKELTAQEKAAATLAIVHKDGARAAGDFARSTGTLAIEQQKAAAAWEDAKATLGEALLPAMTKLAELATDGARAFGAIVEVFSQVPAPVMAAVAALTAAHLLKGPLTSMTTATVSGVRNLTEALNYAQQASARAGGGFAGLAAGVGTFTRGMGPAGGAMGLLKSSASGLLGLLGGPWGLALTGATLAVTSWMQAQANARQAADALRRTLDEQTGAFTENSRKLLQENFFKDFAAEDYARVQDSLAKVRAGIGDLLAAYEQGGDAVTQFNARFDEWRKSAEALDLQAQGVDIQALGNSFASARRDTDAATQAFKVQSEETKRLDSATRDAVPGQEAMAAGIDETKNAAAEARKTLDEMVQAMLKASGRALSTRDAARGFQESIDDVTASIKENGKTLNINTAEGRANQAALDDVARSALDLADSIYAETGSEEKMRASLAHSREVLIKQAEKFGLTRAQAEAYADSVLKIPAAKATKITLNAEQALTQLERVQTYFANIKDKKVTLTVGTVRVGNATENAGRFATGGHVSGPGTATSDSIPAWLSNGEYVIQAAAVARYGRQFFDGLNTMRFASGGIVGHAPTPAASATTYGPIHVTVPVADLPELAHARDFFYVLETQIGMRGGRG